MKTELDKCLSGELYDAHDPVFKQFKQTATRFLHIYNNTNYDESDKRTQLLKETLGSLGDDVSVGTPFLCDYARNIHIGNKVSINMGCSLMDSNVITIEDETMIAPNVQIYTGTHPVKLQDRLNQDWESHREQHFIRTRALPVHIGRGCWIGGGVIILPGVTIGDGSVIGAGSVVTKNIPTNVVAAGDPCKVIHPIDN
ncbi:sugar O-acetyltransferase [Lentilactobacillus diolivorans]|uniref:Maltose O-acetyltransferase n=2 Tax=Lentilactobacillus diolivorans TaxID=179838 RepID=A0A0R1S9S3_9LACO|nr:sugar O-acetyltransferase [Lentilactobacillus diolivorans]KRL62904.1 maltose O-acetyltransferase [Lentilactobacillus diolivorans DSM 14421]GEP23952.1 galactoside O-acetyltransferase [Lentilactobacillus diolivorans]